MLIAPPIIARVVIQMRCRQYHASLSHLRRVLEIRPPRRPTAAIAPSRPSDHEAVRFGHLGAGVGKLSTLRPIGGSDATFVVIRGAGRALVAWI